MTAFLSLLHKPCFVVIAQSNIGQNLISAGNYTTLVAALNSTGILPVLQGTGPFTLFAPTDAAFAKLPIGTVATLLLPANGRNLTVILEYHVVAQLLTTSNFTAMKQPVVLQTVVGATVTVTQNGNNFQVNGANIIIPNIACTNGIIHAIDTVLMPPPSSATSAYLNQGLFAVLVSTIFFSYRLFL
jgi:uncharacterized surface protein with fasciclin (FAS1) repeats